MKFNWKVFFVILPFSLDIGVLSNVYLYLLPWHLGPVQYSRVIWSINVVSFCVSPLVLFASFYFMGRRYRPYSGISISSRASFLGKFDWPLDWSLLFSTFVYFSLPGLEFSITELLVVFLGSNFQSLFIRVFCWFWCSLHVIYCAKTPNTAGIRIDLPIS